MKFSLGIRCSFLIVASLPLFACEPPYHEVLCWQPILRNEHSIRTLSIIGDAEDQGGISNSCPVPAARKFQIEVPGGAATFYWWGSPHRLYFSGRGPGGEALQFSGERVEIYNSSSDSFLAEYSHRVTFSQGNDLVNTRPESESFVIDIVSADGASTSTIQATYDVLLCSCSVPNHFSGVEN